MFSHNKCCNVYLHLTVWILAGVAELEIYCMVTIYAVNKHYSVNKLKLATLYGLVQLLVQYLTIGIPTCIAYYKTMGIF